MSDTERCFVIATDELEKALDRAGTDLNELIRQALPAGHELTAGKNPAYGAETSNEKEVVTIIIASAALIAALTPTLKELIRAATDRPIVATDLHQVPMLDGKGNPILRPDGAPAVAWTQTTRDLNPSTSMTVKGFGLELSIGR
jgi:hypothetical protein